MIKIYCFQYALTKIVNLGMTLFDQHFVFKKK